MTMLALVETGILLLEYELDVEAIRIGLGERGPAIDAPAAGPERRQGGRHE
jgi:hypothetical protein